MNNKPMLSVERELIERAVKACTFVGYEDAAKELRALLDKQSCGACGGCDNGCKLDRESPTIEPAAQHQSEPVAYRYVHDYEHGNGWQRNAVGFEQAKFVDDERKDTWREITPLYAEQPAPVAVVIPEHTMRSVMDAIQQARGFPVLTSNQCHALAESLNYAARLNRVKQ